MPQAELQTEGSALDQASRLVEQHLAGRSDQAQSEEVESSPDEQLESPADEPTAPQEGEQAEETLPVDEELFKLPHRRLGDIEVDRDQLLKYAMIGADVDRRREAVKTAEQELQEKVAGYDDLQQWMSFFNDPQNYPKVQRIAAFLQGADDLATQPQAPQPQAQPTYPQQNAPASDLDAALDSMLEESAQPEGVPAPAPVGQSAPASPTQPDIGTSQLVHAIAELANMVQGIRTEMDEGKQAERSRAVEQATRMLEGQIKSAIETSEILKAVPAARARLAILHDMKVGGLDLRNAVRSVEKDFRATEENGRNKLLEQRREDSQTFVSEPPSAGIPVTSEVYRPGKNDLRDGTTLQHVLNFVRGRGRARPPGS
jgi:hypothetical protein